MMRDISRTTMTKMAQGRRGRADEERRRIEAGLG